MIRNEKGFNKNILIAVDESENASRAVAYVGQILAGIQGFKALVHGTIDAFLKRRERVSNFIHGEGSGCIKISELPFSLKREAISWRKKS